MEIADSEAGAERPACRERRAGSFALTEQVTRLVKKYAPDVFLDWCIRGSNHPLYLVQVTGYTVGGKKKDRYVLYIWKKGPDGKITYVEAQ
jgi:hypothetical protein